MFSSLLLYAALAGAQDDPRFSAALQAAGGGDAKAMSYVGDAYELGRGAPRDHLLALEWYSKAVKAGDGGAAVRLARLNENGYLVAPPATTKIDYAAAAQWYEYGRKLGEPKAATGLGNLAFQGKGMKKDAAFAVSLFKEAADHDPDAAFGLGSILLGGAGVPRDAAGGLGWLKKAGEAGHVRAAKTLAKIYSEGKIVGRDKAEAMRWSGIAAAGGDVESMVAFAGGWWRGDGGTVDLVSADEWYETAAALGSEGGARQSRALAAELSPEQTAQARERARARLARLKGSQ